ncbi:MAG: PEP-CTERM sorting domain-containing protein [Pirellulaceae bacterium]|nr:PEP-CTERM sorting domain-containing protein [Pirellulaceae bacterium]
MMIRIELRTATGRRCVRVAAFTVALAAFVLSAHGTAQASTIADGLQLYSSMNDTTPYLHEAFWVDASGNGYDSQAHDIPSYVGGGNRGTAIDFTLSDNRMTVYNGYDSLLDAGTSDYSVSLWYYETVTAGTAYLFTSGNNASSTRGGFSLRSIDGVPELRMNDVAEGNADPNDTRVTLSAGTGNLSGAWRHLVGVFDRTGNVTGTANTVQFYVDNELKNSTVLADIVESEFEVRPYNVLKSLTKNLLTGVTDQNHGDSVYIGGEGRENYYAFTGYMDDVAVYRGALSAADVNTLHGAAGLTAGTITTPGITPVMVHNFENNLGRSSETLGAVSDDYGVNASTMKNFRQVTDATRGEVLEVRGYSDITEYVSYGDVLDPGTDSFTAALWFKIEDTGNGMQLMGKGANESTSHPGWSVRTDADGYLIVRGTYEVSGVTTKVTVRKMITPGDGQWHHVAIVFDQENGFLQGYLDGEGSGLDPFFTQNGWEAINDGNTFPLGTEFASDQPLLLGYTGESVADGGKTPTVGRFDDFAVWNRALSDAEILGIRNGTLTFPTPTPPNDIPGDANNDGKVDADDAKTLAANWGKSGDAAWVDGDFNGDLKVDAKDAAILAANWGYEWSPAAPAEASAVAAVPEPGTGALLATLLAGLATAFRRRVA